MKLLKETDRVYYYLTKDKDAMIALKFKMEETSMAGDSQCDTCNLPANDYFFCPELGNRLKCTNCFRSYKMDSCWYESDKDFVLNTLLCMVVSYSEKFTEQDLDIINEYLAEHSHREKLDIRHFIKQYGGVFKVCL